MNVPTQIGQDLALSVPFVGYLFHPTKGAGFTAGARAGGAWEGRTQVMQYFRKDRPDFSEIPDQESN